MRTILEISQLLQRLDHVVPTEFIPSITGGITPSTLKRKLLSLPTKLGGLEYQYFQSHPEANTTFLAYWQTICDRKLQTKKEDMKTSQNIKLLKTRSPNFETAKTLKFEV